ncbi:MAG: ubiquinol-cytochrome c reductase iron-sulfur subunit [Actinomycetota bacterium]|nr:ubiquinol-cytochrome c reductase iron-sulfur subunit [Actinomycetota bacterium]
MNQARKAELLAAAAFGVTVVSALGLAFVYLRGGQVQAEGALLALAFAGLAVGFVVWAHHLLPQGPAVQERHPLASPESEREELEDDFERVEVLGRRTLLVRALVAAAGALGVAALFPIRSLGPRPGKSLSTTPWRPGARLVTDEGRPVRLADVAVGALATVFPEGHTGSADAQTVLVRVDESDLEPRPGRESWSPSGLLAYSKVCTHAGCPVGLYQADTHQLLCPCHQSAFDVLDGARPVFGPATRSLPQLPLVVDADGFVRAQSDFHEPIGPAYWDRD